MAQNLTWYDLETAAAACLIRADNLKQRARDGDKEAAGLAQRYRSAGEKFTALAKATVETQEVGRRAA